MNIFKTKNKFNTNTALFILLIMQPIMDVISYFMIENGSTMLTTLVRMVIFAAIVSYSFFASKSKKQYFIMAGVLGVYWILHMIGCFMDGYQSVFQDFALFLRTIHMPVLTLCFIDLFKKDEKTANTVQKAFCCIYFIITAVIVLSYLVGNPVYTYNENVGIKGWFYVGNSQSCIISLLAPLSIYFAYKSKSKLFFAGMTALAFLNMFFYGTRVAYWCIFIVIIGLLFFMITAKQKNYFAYVFLAICFCCAILFYKYSPCYTNMNMINSYVSTRQETIEQLKGENSEAINAVRPNSPSKPNNENDPENRLPTWQTLSPESQKFYYDLYSIYAKPLIDRFGIERTLDRYNYSTDASVFVDGRLKKRTFCDMVMEEKGIMIRLFGFEYAEFLEGDFIAEPENDFPSIYYSNGIVGLIMYITFLLYFLFLMLRKIFTDFKNVFTIENGMVAVTAAIIMGAALFSGNVFKRPNVIIYLSLTLAYIYYLCVVKKKENNEQ